MAMSWGLIVCAPETRRSARRGKRRRGLLRPPSSRRASRVTDWHATPEWQHRARRSKVMTSEPSGATGDWNLTTNLAPFKRECQVIGRNQWQEWGGSGRTRLHRTAGSEHTRALRRRHRARSAMRTPHLHAHRGETRRTHAREQRTAPQSQPARPFKRPTNPRAQHHAHTPTSPHHHQGSECVARLRPSLAHTYEQGTHEHTHARSHPWSHAPVFGSRPCYVTDCASVRSSSTRVAGGPELAQAETPPTP